MKALVVVDLQNDFVTGSLAVTGAEAVVKRILASAVGYSLVAATRDWHPADHCSFKEQGGGWPAHCVQGTEGAEYVPGLQRLVTPGWHFIKGYNRDQEQYSGAEAVRFAVTTLAEDLRIDGWQDVDVVGLALDYCVKWTAADLAALGFNVRVLLPCTAAVTVGGEDSTLRYLRSKGVEIAGNRLAPGE